MWAEDRRAFVKVFETINELRQSKFRFCFCAGREGLLRDKLERRGWLITCRRRNLETTTPLELTFTKHVAKQRELVAH